MSSFYTKYDSNKEYLSKKKSGSLFLKNIFKAENLPFLVLFILMVVMHRFIKMTAGDDMWFAQESKNYSFLGYVAWRYQTWSGRVSVESILYYIFRDKGQLWKILNPMFILLFTYSISRILIGKEYIDRKKHCLINWIICFGWLYISRQVLYESFFWITGSINYLWTIAAGLCAIIPYRDALIGEYKEKVNILYFLCAIFAGLGQEQVALVMTTFAVIINIHILIRDKKPYKYLIFQTLIIIGSSFVLFLAPGNYVRVHAETNTWLPNFPFYSIWEFGFNGIQWFLDCVINYSRLIFLLVISIIGIAMYKQHNGIKGSIVTIIPFTASTLIIISMGLLINVDIPKVIMNKIHFSNIYNNLASSVNYLFFNFFGEFNLRSFGFIKFIGWSVLISLIPFYIITLYKFTQKGMYCLLLYLAGLCSAIVIFASPTIYASGVRTIFTLNVLFFMIFIFILKSRDELLENKYVILFLILPIFKYIMFFSKYIKDFMLK